MKDARPPLGSVASLGASPVSIFGTLAQDLDPAVSAKRGRWVTINVWEPDPAANPITVPDPDDVLPITGVSASAFVVAGDYTAELRDEFPLVVRDSTPNVDGVSNDGWYFCAGDPTFASGSTTVNIVGQLPDVAITDGVLVIVRPTVLRNSGRKVVVVSRSTLTAFAGTFVVATPLGFEWLIEIINCAAEEEEA